MMRKMLLVVGLVGLFGCNGTVTPPSPVLACSEVDTLRQAALSTSDLRYIVTLDNAADASEVLDRSPERLFTKVFPGFAAALSPGELEQLKADPRVTALEVDRVIPALADTQTTAPWGLDRIDQRKLTLDGLYIYDTNAAGVVVYVLDTGIQLAHPEFEGRAVFGFDAFGANGIDCHSHGTHVAGIIGSKDYGVAKKVTLVAVRVLDCAGSGLFSQVIAGLDYIAAQSARPAVVNVSLGAEGESDALEAAVRSVIGGGVQVVMAGGNNSGSACLFTPAREPLGITVGATDEANARAVFSNFGTCLSLFAPGVRIPSVFYLNNDPLILSGTSMAAPHVAGVVALTLAQMPTATPADVKSLLLAIATRNTVTGIDSTSPDRLLFSRLAVSIPQPPLPPPAILPTTIVRVNALLGSNKFELSSAGPEWRAYAHVSVEDANGNPVTGVVVTVAYGALGQGECMTDAIGDCKITTPLYSCAIPRLRLVVTGIRGNKVLFDVQNSVTLMVTVERPA